MWLLYHIYLNMYITSDIYRFVDVIKDIVRAFKFITMGVLNICPDALRSPVELGSKVSDDQVKIARCVWGWLASESLRASSASGKFSSSSISGVVTSTAGFRKPALRKHLEMVLGVTIPHAVLQNCKASYIGNFHNL